MALVVEDGTGGDALVSLNDFEVYCEDHGYDISAFTDPELEVSIRKASTFISTNFTYQGYKVGGRTQLQAFPRYDVADREGFAVDWETIPWEVEHATCEAAFFDLNNPGLLNPSVSLTERVIRESVGPITVEYAGTAQNIDAARPTLLIVVDLLQELLDRGGGVYGVTARANRG